MTEHREGTELATITETTGQFRSATFGGFNRQDVLDYIEKITLEHKEGTAALEADLDQIRSAHQQSEQDLKEAQRRLGATEVARQKLEKELAAMRTKLEETEAALQEAQVQNAKLEGRLQAIQPEADSWKRIKDTAGEIEVAAHERAQVTLQDARAQAAEIQAKSLSKVLEIQGRCDKLQEDLRTAIVSAETELDQVRASFARAQTDMEGFQKSLSDLVAEGSKN